MGRYHTIGDAIGFGLKNCLPAWYFPKLELGVDLAVSSRIDSIREVALFEAYGAVVP